MAKSTKKPQNNAVVTSNKIVEGLNTVLANYHIFYMNVRGYHWNVKGTDFFVIHQKTEELYTQLQLQIDAIAERILTIKGTPLHAYSRFAQISQIEEQTDVTDTRAVVEGLLSGLNILISKQREVIELAEEHDDQGTADLLTAYVQEQEKLLWMYNAYLG